MNIGSKSDNIWDKVALNFGKVGPRYWEDFGTRLVELSYISRGARVLDIGMGRGASLFPALDKVGKDGYVIGIDNSEVMVNETYNDILHRNISNAEVKNMNAKYLDFQEESFDNIICGFGFGYLMQSEGQLNEILRLLKKGGQVGFSIWGIQEDQKWLTEIVNKFLPHVKENKNNKKTDISKFDTVDDIRKILNNFGFINIKVYYEDSEVIYKDEKEWWQEMWTNAVRGIFDQIEDMGCDVFTEFKKDIWKGLEKFGRGKELCFNMPVIYAFGEKQF
ncbi:class I SAM-dependent methyltransferase [Clostridium sp. YIM B02515]|uniref:Class I SAM-dependent methyltransferase n=1 Tax=Clostridium rhizosphaerae TaxID=2803861 RepID=A0ABS1THE6_9CLOT|nr:class I SAM-dependent methyltransferase [Clostridium rhizosphaerae]MBL4938517.1 class I SAM-dependent methyltransferase [Clostridium rhizosphaerae]